MCVRLADDIKHSALRKNDGGMIEDVYGEEVSRFTLQALKSSAHYRCQPFCTASELEFREMCSKSCEAGVSQCRVIAFGGNDVPAWNSPSKGC